MNQKWYDQLLKWAIENHNNKLLMGLMTFTCPEKFLKSIYQKNLNQPSKWSTKACLTLSFDCDYEEDVSAFPELLKILDNYKFKTSFACVGNWIERFPAAHSKLLEYGHEIVNHTYSHPDNEILNPGRKFRTLPLDEKLLEITQCHEVCRKLLNYEPIGCRIPHFRNLFSDDIYQLLERTGYRYSSSTWITRSQHQGMPFQAANGIWEFPLSTCPKHPFTVFDTWHSFNSKRLAYRLVHNTEEEYFALFKKLIDWGIETNSYINVYLDPLDIPKMKYFQQLCDYISARSAEISLMTYQQLVDLLDS